MAGLTLRCKPQTKRKTLRTKATAENHGVSIHLPEVAGHPNRLPFEGCLTMLDIASDKPPSGARGHRVILTRAAGAAALPSLLGMALDFTAGWDGHNSRQKFGLITTARIEGYRLMVGGYLFVRDFPEITAQILGLGEMGMSYELADAHVSDMRSPVWVMTKATFTGAAVLLRSRAAYRGTSFRLLGLPDDGGAKPTGAEGDFQEVVTAVVSN